MSRCFPFPPPGYENKPTTAELEPLLKEKHKEKKHKKEKRDKKKEGKEKKDKDTSKDKHQEKKERKEKHKERKKSKDKNKTDEKKIDGQSEGYNRGKHGENTHKNVDIKDSKFAVEFSRRIGDEERGGRNQMVENFTANDQRKVDGICRMVKKDNRIEDKKGHEKKTDKPGIKNEERGAGTTMLPSSTGVDRKRVEGMARQVENQRGAGSTVLSGSTGVDLKRVEGMVRQVENAERVSGSTMLRTFTGVDRKSVDGMARLVEKDAEKIGWKEKNEGKGVDGKTKDVQKDKNGEKKSKGKDKHRDKDKAKMEKVSLEKRKQDQMRESHKDPINMLNIKPLQIPLNTVQGVDTEDNPKKRKDFQTNGILRDNDVRPNKLLKPTISSHPFNGNGRKLEPCRTAIQCASGTHGGLNNLKVDNKEHKVNGLVEAESSSISFKTSSFATSQDSENGKASIEPPPHPDSKYLSQILSVPKMMEWSEFVDQEWLFSRSSLQPKKLKDESSGVDEAPQVWDKALQIASADVCALPYVVPY